MPIATKGEFWFVKKSKVHGRGLFARKDIPKGTKIIEYKGTRMPPDALPEWQHGRARIPEAPLEMIVDVPAELLRRRPDVRAAEMQLAAQSAQKKAAAGAKK